MCFSIIISTGNPKPVEYRYKYPSLIKSTSCHNRPMKKEFRIISGPFSVTSHMTSPDTVAGHLSAIKIPSL